MNVDQDRLRRAFGDHLKKRQAFLEMRRRDDMSSKAASERRITGDEKDEAAVELMSVWPRGKGDLPMGLPPCLYAVVTYKGQPYVVNPGMGLCEPAIILNLDES